MKWQKFYGAWIDNRWILTIHFDDGTRAHKGCLGLILVLVASLCLCRWYWELLVSSERFTNWCWDSSWVGHLPSLCGPLLDLPCHRYRYKVRAVQSQRDLPPCLRVVTTCDILQHCTHVVWNPRVFAQGWFVYFLAKQQRLPGVFTHIPTRHSQIESVQQYYRMRVSVCAELCAHTSVSFCS